MRRISRSVVSGLVAFALSTPAFAESGFWQRFSRPRAVLEQRLLASLERTLDDASRSSVFELGFDRELARGAVAMIELSGITEPNDPRLAYVEARALVEADIGREADARRLLEGAIEKLPPGSLSASAWSTLARALGRLDDSRAEHHAYTRVIELAWDPELRALAHYNRGEVSMRGRDLVNARADYEKAVAGARDPSLIALARYGLAVAEERLGDLPAAFAVLDKALLVNLPVPPFPSADPLDLPGTYFVPVYEENYIRALRAMAMARRALLVAERRDAFETAVAEWDTYLARTPEDEPFRENARALRARAERELTRLPVPVDAPKSAR
jgi:tetratricopeptide (TPR) repeat protein